MSVSENPGYAPLYRMVLLFEGAPEFDLEAAAENLSPILGSVKVEQDGQDWVLQVAEHTVDESGNECPARFRVRVTPKGEEEALSEDILRQSFQTPGAKDLAARITSQAIVVAENLDSLAVKDRQGLLGAMNRVVCGTSNAVGLLAPHLGQLFEAEAFMESPEPLFGFVGVRFFDGGPQGQVMDTMGLSALGLYDLQLHFRDLEPKEVSRALWIIARYVFDDEPTIKDGDTVTGIHGDPWKVRFERPLVPPDRIVLDLHPGEGFAAGQR